MANGSSYHHIAIDLFAIPEGRSKGTVTLDGVELKGVRSIRVESRHDDVTEVTLTLIASVSGTIDGARVTDVE